MIITEKILLEFFSINNYNWNELKSLVNDHITEIDKTYNFEFEPYLVIGEIIDFKKITGTKKLSLVTVNIKNDVLNIVCGASNLEQETKRKVVVALAGHYIKSTNTLIENKNIFGIDSKGMLCSAEELGLDPIFLTEEEKKGILFLDNEATVGAKFSDYLVLQGGLWKLSITPDRGDLLSYLGFTKDLKILSNDVNKLQFHHNLSRPIEKNIKNPFEIEIMNENCSEYNVLYIKNIEVKPSPLWLRNLLFIHEITSVNNIIDITNLLLIKYGIPIETFDASKLDERKIQIRSAHKEEIFVCSNNKKYNLDTTNLVTVNKNNILSLTGIINSQKNNIHSQTKEIIITTTLLNSLNISKTSKRMNIENEKTARLVKGIDPSLTQKVLDYFVILLKKIEPNLKLKISNIKHVQTQNLTNPEIYFSLDDLYNKIGISFSQKEVIDFLTRLEYEIQIINDNCLKVKAPSRRHDVKIPEDVFSDLVRAYGYKKIQQSELINSSHVLIENSKEKIYQIKHLLSILGFFEVINYSLVNEQIFNLFPHSSDYIKVINPISQEQLILRQHLGGSIIQNLSYNQKHDNYNNSFFEIGKVYYPEKEKLHLSLALSGYLGKENWSNSHIKSSFFVLKGILEKIGLLLGIDFQFKKSSLYSNLHPGKQADILYQNKKIGFIGELHPSLEKLYSLKTSFIAEIDLEKLYLEHSKKNIFQNISKFPSIIRDLSFWVSKKYSFENIKKTLIEDMPDFLLQCELLDIYECPKISSEEHSLTFNFIFNDRNKSLSHIIVNEIMQKIENKIKKIYKVKIR